MTSFNEDLRAIAQKVCHEKEVKEVLNNLYLNHYNDPPVRVPSHVVKEIKPQHVLGLSFLYERMKANKAGSILNQDEGLNWYLQVSAFLNAMYHSVDFNYAPTAILCPSKNAAKWHYHITNHGEISVRVMKQDEVEIFKKNGLPDVIIVPFLSGSVLNLFKNEFAFFIVEDIDVVINKQAVKRIKTKFKIGLTHRNFIMHKNPKIQWHILNWANKGCVGKQNTFYGNYKEFLKDLVEPYTEWWQRLTWDFCETFVKLNPEEEKIYNETILEWSQLYKLEDIDEIEKIKINSRKRLNSNQKTSSASDIPKKCIKKQLTPKKSPENHNVVESTKCINKQSTYKNIFLSQNHNADLKKNFNKQSTSKNTLLQPTHNVPSSTVIRETKTVDNKLKSTLFENLTVKKQRGKKAKEKIIYHSIFYSPEITPTNVQSISKSGMHIEKENNTEHYSSISQNNLNKIEKSITENCEEMDNGNEYKVIIDENAKCDISCTPNTASNVSQENQFIDHTSSHLEEMNASIDNNNSLTENNSNNGEFSILKSIIGGSPVKSVVDTQQEQDCIDKAIFLDELFGIQKIKEENLQKNTQSFDILQNIIKTPSVNLSPSIEVDAISKNNVIANLFAENCDTKFSFSQHLSPNSEEREFFLSGLFPE